MRRVMIGVIPTVAVALLSLSFMVFGSSNTVSAAKPLRVIEWSNGFPSGEHFNLNIHGKKDDYFLNCNDGPGGGSVFVPEYGDSEIQYIQNKKSSVSELNVIDKCSSAPEGDPAKVQLPKGEYQVYARILAKPKKNGEPRDVIFYPRLIDQCNFLDGADPDLAGDAIDCSDGSLVGLGTVTKDGVFDKDSQSLERAAPVKGGNKAVEITELFQWSGWVCDAAFDSNGDGEITEADLDTNGDGVITLDDLDTNGDGVVSLEEGDLNEDGIVNEDDLALYTLAYYLATNCDQFTSEWVFNIADLVVYGWDYKNNGAKLVQVRFYPVATTTFQ